jgi:hypothetical protein
MSLSKNKTVATLGKTWITVGAIIGGISYLLYPSTSLTEVQAFHLLALHGMSYHATMLYLGLLYFLHGEAEPTWKNFKYYGLFVGAFCAFIITIDYAFDVNLMFLAKANRLPEFAQAVCNFSRPLFTILASGVYIVVPYIVVNLMMHIRDAIRQHRALMEPEEEKDSVQAK